VLAILGSAFILTIHTTAVNAVDNSVTTVPARLKYPPFLLFNQSGDLERALLRSSQRSSASCRWRVPLPVIGVNLQTRILAPGRRSTGNPGGRRYQITVRIARCRQRVDDGHRYGLTGTSASRRVPDRSIRLLLLMVHVKLSVYERDRLFRTLITAARLVDLGYRYGVKLEFHEWLAGVSGTAAGSRQLDGHILVVGTYDAICEESGRRAIGRLLDDELMELNLARARSAGCGPDRGRVLDGEREIFDLEGRLTRFFARKLCHVRGAMIEPDECIDSRKATVLDHFNARPKAFPRGLADLDTAFFAEQGTKQYHQRPPPK
jgi:hypothetical protein